VPAASEPAPRRPLSILERPLFWVLVIAIAFSIPLVKALTSHLPPRLPGEDRAPEDCELPDEAGASVSLASLRGSLVVVTPLSLANADERQTAIRNILGLRKHLRGLDQALIVVTLCRGGTAADLSPLLDEHKARKPANVFLLDEDGAAFARLAAAAGAPSANALLLDRHGRIRGAYGDGDAEQKRLIAETGQIANWVGEDSPP
jgi:hypothetical protein